MAIGDAICGAAGTAAIGVAAVDSVVSWPSDRLLMAPDALERLEAVLIVGPWIWLMAAVVMISGVRPSNAAVWQHLRPSRFPRLALAGLAILSLTVIVGGFALGATKGSVRILQGPTYQVSVPDVNGSSWTTVSAHQYRVWAARIVRLDGTFAFFGLFVVATSWTILGAHRRHGPTLGSDPEAP